MFGVLAAISSFFSQLDDFILYDVLYRDIQGVIRNALDGALAIFVLFIVPYALSVGRHLLRYAFFTVRNQEDMIVISRRLLEKQLSSVSRKRVQGMIIKENVIQRLFGYVSVHIIHAGGSLDGGEDGSVVLCPFVKKERAVSVITALSRVLHSSSISVAVSTGTCSLYASSCVRICDSDKYARLFFTTMGDRIATFVAYC